MVGGKPSMILKPLYFLGIALNSALIKIISITQDNIRLRSIELTFSALFWAFISVANLVSQGSFGHPYTVSTGFIIYSGVAVVLWTSKEINHGRE